MMAKRIIAKAFFWGKTTGFEEQTQGSIRFHILGSTSSLEQSKINLFLDAILCTSLLIAL